MRLNQIIINLISNSIKFTKRGSVELSVKSAIQSDDSYLYSFNVKDTGIGIPDKFHSKIFQKFSQSDTSINRTFGGTGLGLAISKELTDLMHGKIDFISQVAVGTTFTVSIPFKLADKFQVANKSISKSVTQTAKEFSKFHVLVADDHPVNLLFNNKLLKKMGFVHIDQVVNGREAIEKWNDPEKHYDVILMDCQMPEVDGLEATRQIRQIEYKNSSLPVPIVAMTARALESDRDECLQSGMNDYISKPVNPSKLFAVLARLLLTDHAYQESSSSSQTLSINEVIDLDHLNLFTDGDLAQEKLISNLFLTKAKESLLVLKTHLEGKASLQDWVNAAHKLKGSAAQIGANDLSAACLLAEKQIDDDLNQKISIYEQVNTAFKKVDKYFSHRHQGI